MNGKFARTLYLVSFAVAAQLWSVAANTDAVQTSSKSGSAVCDTQSHQRSTKKPETVGMALMGLGLLAVGAATRRSAVKQA